jgi:hypothetical protein
MAAREEAERVFGIIPVDVVMITPCGSYDETISYRRPAESCRNDMSPKHVQKGEKDHTKPWNRLQIRKWVKDDQLVLETRVLAGLRGLKSDLSTHSRGATRRGLP